jgi:formylglycine-generating enzyme required for sulfatase activity
MESRVNGKKDSGWFELEENGLGQKARLQEDELKKREEAAEWEATRASVDSINRELRKDDPHRPGETKTITLPGGARMEMVWCPPGAFMMGSPKEDAEHGESEVEHRVTLTEGFWMAKTEVTQAQWEKVMGSNPAKQAKGDDLPAVNVSWLDSRFFCERSGLALPSETQWEYACRAGSTGAYGGTGRLDDMGWHGGNSGEKLHPVGKKKANAWGLCDMHGNVAEWCADSAIKYSNESVTNPPVRENGDTRAVRGGGFRFPPDLCRSASWTVLDVKTASGLLGLRPICVDLEAQEEMTAKTDRLCTELASLGRGTQAGETKTIHLFEGTPMEMAWCPPGSFTMGAGVEGSEHKVTLTEGFWLAKTEVSQAQWKDAMGFNPAESKHGGLSIDKPNGIPGDDLPVVGISWEWCRQFCLKTGLKLPTEAQWEYACGAGNWQMENASYGAFIDTGWYNMASSWAKVDSGDANAWGFRNMMGNVAEWCSDWFVYPMGKEAATDPAGPETGEKRVVRTGYYSRTVRIGLEPSNAYNKLGFRPCYP